MKNMTVLVALVAIILSSCNENTPGIVAERVLDTMDDNVDSLTVLTTEDSMKLVFDELQVDYLQFLNQNKEFSVDNHTAKRFAYKDSLGKEVWLEVFDLIDYAALDLVSGSYSVAQEGEHYIMHTYKGTGKHRDDDSLVVQTPEELKMALLPFHVHMKEATIAVAKLRIERSTKMKEMMQSAL